MLESATPGKSGEWGTCLRLILVSIQALNSELNTLVDFAIIAPVPVCLFLRLPPWLSSPCDLV